ncbi:putative phage integrase [Yersinia pseudotuberculosis]|uniref:Putative phage integrase n=1 Tax=Yersinia pseudotuberculosis TaxID=633 RepID=A0A380Q618_YERPU|nr:tyrosine-type recombinase/integrase [Yersinia pseudotuberculosis]SUP80992.1 putative phage integrase [Yersinia pseudotuberculosis]
MLGAAPASELKYEKQRLLEESQKSKAAVLTLWTGCLTGEVCNMAWEDVDLDKGTIHLRKTKTVIERYVQLSTQAIEFIKVLRLTSDKYLFPSQATKLPIQQKYLTENAWR